MCPSRRTLLRLTGAVVTTILAGCSAIGSQRSASGSSDPDTEQATPDPSAAERFAVRLRGPETDRVLFTGDDIGSIGSVERRSSAPGFTITLTDAARRDVARTFQTAGVTESPGEFEIVHTDADRRYDISDGLAVAIAEGEWDGQLRLTYATEERAMSARERLVGAT
ncbi:hypothetical protein [Haloarcula montana]|uniref:hypothetical protein n=1 Tax=Haloarcula montana TaxID=3111776 RepID=UPI002D7960E0|nr:hypothetical protein [Haloarcula sp. GH36]